MNADSHDTRHAKSSLKKAGSGESGNSFVSMKSLRQGSGNSKSGMNKLHINKIEPVSSN